jgi:hypothetical protein
MQNWHKTKQENLHLKPANKPGRFNKKQKRIYINQFLIHYSYLNGCFIYQTPTQSNVNTIFNNYINRKTITFKP